MDPATSCEVSSDMAKYDDIYKLTMAVTQGSSGQRREAGVSRSVGDFIDENGIVCHDIIEQMVIKLHKSLAAEKKEN